VSGRLVLAFAGSAALMSVLDGAARSLTAAPPILTFCASASLLMLSMQARTASHAITRGRWFIAALAGVCAGLTLSHATPAAPRDVVARVPRNHIAADLFDALDQLDANPAVFDHRTIEVSGTWTPPSAQSTATISRRVMSCCTADSVDVGFDVITKIVDRVQPGAWVHVSGRVRGRLRNGELRYEIVDASVRRAAPP
jgi:uncharacterized membrane protein YcgQ (UPF0703/DUF1980 family)